MARNPKDANKDQQSFEVETAQQVKITATAVVENIPKDNSTNIILRISELNVLQQTIAEAYLASWGTQSGTISASLYLTAGNYLFEADLVQAPGGVTSWNTSQLEVTAIAQNAPASVTSECSGALWTTLSSEAEIAVSADSQYFVTSLTPGFKNSPPTEASITLTIFDNVGQSGVPITVGPNLNSSITSGSVSTEANAAPFVVVPGKTYKIKVDVGNLNAYGNSTTLNLVNAP